VVESLIKAGAFDSLGAKRSQLFAIIDQALEQAQAAQRDRQSGQISLFSVMSDEATLSCPAISLPDIAEWNEKDKLAFEKETVGFYITGHPLHDFKEEIDSIAETPLVAVNERTDGQIVRVGGLVNGFKEHKSKKGERMGFLTLEDIAGTTEVVIFPEVFSQCSHLLASNEPLIVQGTVKKDERGGKIIAEAVDSLTAARNKYTDCARIRLQAHCMNRTKLEALKKILLNYHGSCPVSLTLHFDGRGEVDIETQKDFTIQAGAPLTKEVNKFLGEKAVTYQVKPLAPTDRSPGNGFRAKGRGEGQSQN